MAIHLANDDARVPTRQVHPHGAEDLCRLDLPRPRSVERRWGAWRLDNMLVWRGEAGAMVSSLRRDGASPGAHGTEAEDPTAGDSCHGTAVRVQHATTGQVSRQACVR